MVAKFEPLLTLALLLIWTVVSVIAVVEENPNTGCLLLALPVVVWLHAKHEISWFVLAASILIAVALLATHQQALGPANGLGLALLVFVAILQIASRYPRQAKQTASREVLPNESQLALTHSLSAEDLTSAPEEMSFAGDSVFVSSSNSLEETDDFPAHQTKHNQASFAGGSDRTKLSSRRISDQLGEVLERLNDEGDFAPRQIQNIRKTFASVFHEATILDLSIEELRKGHQIGDYTIERLLGTGGAARVYLARNLQTELVAIKVLHNAKFSARFEREIKLIQQLAHPNIVTAYEAGVANGTSYLAMEYLPGGTLYRFIKANGAMKWPETLEVIYQATLGLQHAHGRGLIHRDIKPGNLIWDASRHLKITDLGLAGIVESHRLIGEDDFPTRYESIAGTPDFMAPEQAFSLGSATIASDIFSLGATWHYLLTGKTRNSGRDTVDKLARLQKDMLDSLPEDCAPANVRNVLARMTAYDMQDRYADTTQLLVDLNALRSPTAAEREESHLRVLVVEDDQDDLFVTLEILKRVNQLIRTDQANSLTDALEFSQQKPYDAILLDLSLSDSQGLCTVERMREAFQDSPIIVLTGNDDIQVGKACIKAGADEYICKADLTVQQLERSIFITQSRVQGRLRHKQ